MPGLGERERETWGGRNIGRKGKKGREADRDEKWRQDKKEVNEREEKREDGGDRWRKGGERKGEKGA